MGILKLLHKTTHKYPRKEAINTTRNDTKIRTKSNISS